MGLLLAAAAGAWALWNATGEVDRLYLSWSRDRVAAPIAAGDLQPSPVAPVAWGGRSPLVIRLPARQGPARLELKLRTSRSAVRLVLDAGAREVARWRVGRGWQAYGAWLPPQAARVVIRVGEGRGPVHISRIKLTNVVGSTEGAVDAWIAPRGVPRHPAPPAVRAVLVGGWLLCLGVGAGVVRVRRTGVAAAAGAAAATLALVAVAVALSLTRLALVAAPGTVVILAAAGAAAGVVSALPRWVSRLREEVHVRPVVLAEAAILTALLSAWVWALTLVVVGEFAGDLRGTARFGWRFQNPPALEDVPEPGRAGYDGQFYAVLATDPWLRDPSTLQYLDNPTYRATRMLLPALAWALSGGRAELAPRVYVLLCWFLGLAAVALVHLELRRGPWWWVVTPALALSSGLACSVLRATPDGAAVALLVAALVAAGRFRPSAAAGLGSLAALARETSVLAAPAAALALVRRGRRGWAAAAGALPVLLVAAWRLHITGLTGRGVGSAVSNFAPPLSWAPEKLARMAAAGFPRIEVVGMVWVGLALLATLALAAHPRRLGSLGLAFVGFGALAWVLGIRVYSEVNAYARVLVALPFLAGLTLAEERRRWLRALLLAVVIVPAIQGAMVLQSELGRARRGLGRPDVTRAAGTGGAHLALAGEWRREGHHLALPPGGRGSVGGTTAGRRLHVAVDRGRLELSRGGQRVVELGPGDVAMFPLPPGRANQLSFHAGRDGAVLSLEAGFPGDALRETRSLALVPGAAAVAGTTGRWRTDVVFRRKGSAATWVQVEVWRRSSDGHGVRAALLPLTTSDELVVRDVVATLFGVQGAGVLRARGVGGEVEVEAWLVLERGAEAAAWALPVLKSPQRLPLRWRHDALRAGRVDVLMANPSGRALELRLESRGRRLGTVTLAPQEVRQLHGVPALRGGRLDLSAVGSGDVVTLVTFVDRGEGLTLIPPSGAGGRPAVAD